MLCLIPARGGSTRIPRKNIKIFHGQPIIAYSIETALDSELFDDVIVSTEDTEIARIAGEYGASVLARSEVSAHNDVGTQEVAREAFNSLRGLTTYSCVLYATCPLLTVAELQDGFDRLLDFPSLDYAYSVDWSGKDAGAYYFGRTSAFKKGRSLHKKNICVPIENALDINIEADWQLAEERYAEIHNRSV